MSSSPALDLAAITERLITVENELAALKRQVQTPADQSWYLKHAGKFAGDPEFEEIIRLGKEIREADLPGF